MTPIFDIVLVVDTLHTMAGSTVRAPAAIGIQHGRVMALADAATAVGWSTRRVVRFPAGATAVPGLVDAHSHPIMGLSVTDGVDLTRAKDAADVGRLLATDALAGGSRGWVLGWGLDPSVLGSDPVAALAAVGESVDLPVFVRLFDVHSAYANAAALECARVDRAVRLADGAYVDGDAAGVPTAMLHAFAGLRLIEDVIAPEPSDRTVKRLHRVLREMAASGLTGAHIMDAEGHPESLLVDAEADADLPIRLRLSPWLAPADDLRLVRSRLGRRGRRWIVDGVKLFLDGTIDNGTAWLHEPDTFGQSREPVWADPEAYSRAVLDLDLDLDGIPTATHAIGDAAVHHALQTLRRRPLRVQHRIEHLETASDDVIDLLGARRIAASMQPAHCTHFVRADHSDNWSRRLGAARAGNGWRTRDVLDAGAILALGSDWPVAPFAPLEVMAAARMRRPAGRRTTPVNAAQALTAREALAGYTTGSHAAIGVRGGTLVTGAVADVTVLAADPLRVDADVLAATPVLLTMVDGRIVHQAD